MESWSIQVQLSVIWSIVPRKTLGLAGTLPLYNGVPECVATINKLERNLKIKGHHNREANSLSDGSQEHQLSL